MVIPHIGGQRTLHNHSVHSEMPPRYLSPCLVLLELPCTHAIESLMSALCKSKTLNSQYLGDATCTNRGKIAFADSGTVLCYSIVLIKLSCYVSVQSGPSLGI